MDFFIKYLKERKELLIMLLIFIIIFVITFALYQLPLKAVLYPALLCVVIGIIYMLFDFIRIRKKHLMLTEIQKLTAEMIDSFGKETNIFDQDYQSIIFSLQKEIKQMQETATVQYQDMIDYYTVWAHQIKTPVASIKLTLQNEDSALSRQLQSDLFRIEQYVDMVLTYLRLDSSTSDYVFKKHSIDPIIRQTVKKFSHEFIIRKLALEYEPIEKAIITDEKWFGFVLEQVLSNSLKYTYTGGIKIYLEDNILCIADTGIGISPEDLPRIFEKGYTGDNGRTDKKASGIGLYLCKRICKNLGINITAESEIGKGTVIRIDLDQYQIKKE